jgi:Ca2+-binding RTX toxin-like protein
VDSLSGDGGNDRITGGQGQDSLAGGSGSDSFVFADDANAGTVAGADLITDWDSSDTIAFSTLPGSYAEISVVSVADAIAAAVADGSRAFAVYASDSDLTYVFFDIDGLNNGGDVVVALTGDQQANLGAANFV